MHDCIASLFWRLSPTYIHIPFCVTTSKKLYFLIYPDSIV